MNNKVYMVKMMIDGTFCNYMMDSVYSTEEQAINEVKRIYELKIYRMRNVKTINNNWKSVQIVDKDDEHKIYEWFGYEVLNII